MSKSRSVALVVGALAMSVAGRAAEVHAIELEGYLTPPTRARVDASSPAPSSLTGPELPAYAFAPKPSAATALPPVISLVWIDASGAAAGSDRAARDESASLLRALGLAAEWRSGRAGEPALPGEVRVILLDRAAVDGNRSPVLGSTPARFESEPYFWVHVPGVRGALGLDPRRRLGPAELRDRHMLGVALGRVIAHETVHAVAPGVPHGAGLMAPRLRKNDLVSRTLAVPAELGVAVRAALAGGAAAPIADGGRVGEQLLSVGGDGPEMPR